MWISENVLLTSVLAKDTKSHKYRYLVPQIQILSPINLSNCFLVQHQQTLFFLPFRNAQQKNVSFSSVWSLITITLTDRGNTLTGTWH